LVESGDKHGAVVLAWRGGSQTQDSIEGITEVLLGHDAIEGECLSARILLLCEAHLVSHISALELHTVLVFDSGCGGFPGQLESI
jgi:hypothetical protein